VSNSSIRCIIVTHLTSCRCNAPESYTELRGLPSLNPSISVVNTSPSAAHIVPEISEIIDVDSFEVEKSLQQPKRLAIQCNGYSLIFPDGKSPHTAYSFALHDTRILPWDYAIRSDKMSLFSQGCTGIADDTRPC
jgi:hypothetical protein